MSSVVNPQVQQGQQMGQQMGQGQSPSLVRSMQAAVMRGVGRLTGWTRRRTEPGFIEDQVKLVNDEFDRRHSERLGLTLQWLLQLAFLAGDQYCDINVTTQEIVETSRLNWYEQRESFNQLAPTIEVRTAKIGRMQPKLMVRPSSSDMDHLSSAKIALKLVDHCDRDSLDEDQRQALYAWMESCGTVFIKNTWDPTAGAVIGYMSVEVLDENPAPAEETPPEKPSDPMTEAGAQAAQQFEGAQAAAKPVDIVQEGTGLRARAQIEIHEGDARSDVIPPFEVYPDSLMRPQVGDCRSIIHARAYHVLDVKEIWGKEVAAEAGVETWGSVAKTQATGGLGYGTGSYRYAGSDLKDHVLVKEYWERPGMNYPEGRLITVAGKTLLYSGPLPYNVEKDGRPGLPFVKIVDIVRPGSFFGACVTERLIPVQRRYNAWNNRRAEYLTRVAFGNLAVEEGAVTDLVALEQNATAPGTIFKVRRGFQFPKWMDFPSLPASFENEGPRLLHEFTMISGVSETSRLSEAPAGVKSGIALNLIIEQDNTRISHTVGNVEQGKIKWGKQILRLYKQFADRKRVLKTTGSDNSVDILYWDQSDITSDDVIIQTSALLSDTPTQRRQTAMELLAAGFFNDADTGRLTRAGKSKVLEMLQYGDWEYGTDVDELQIKCALRENREMMQGQLPPAKDFHNEELHVGEHIKFMLTDEFYQTDAKAGGQLEALVNQHIQMHAMLMAKKQAALMSQQAPQTPQGGTE